MSQWVATVEKTTGKTYYYDKVTKATRWSKPEGFDDALATPPTDPELDPANWAKARHEASGRDYYYNKKTKKTAWERPACMGPAESATSTANSAPVSNIPSPISATAPTATAAAPATVTATPVPQPVAAAPAPAAAAASLWREAKDPASGKIYWYNKQTKQTTWTRPTELSAPAPAAAAPAAAPAASSAPAAAPAVPVMPARPAAPRPAPTVPAVASVAVVSAAPAGSAAAPADPEGSFGVGAGLSPEDHTHLHDDGDDSETADAKVGVLNLTNEDEESDKETESVLQFAAHRKGLVNRILRQKSKKLTNELLLSFKKSLIKKALLKQNRNLDEEAIQSFKNVMSYMGDRSTSKGPMDHAKKMLRNLLVAPSGLRDEVYIQIAKQTNGNPRESATIKGWELMRFCLATFPPSKAIRVFLVNYITTNTTAGSAAVRAIAQMCLTQVAQISAAGQRKQIPSVAELTALAAMQPVQLTIPLLDGTKFDLGVDSYTTVAQVEELVHARLNVQFIKPFALYECGAANVERLLDGKERVLDVVASWENAPPDAEDNRAGAKNAPVHKSIYGELLYKAKLVLRLDVPELANDPEAIRLVYIQAVRDVVTDRYPIKEKDAVALAAIQLRAEGAGGVDAFTRDVSRYVPPGYYLNEKQKLDSARVQALAGQVSDNLAKLGGYTTADLHAMYLKYAQELTCYGATVFLVEQRQFKEYPSPLLLGVTCESVLLLHPERRNVFEVYKYPDIVTWGHSDEKFIVVVGNIVQQRKLVFKTEHGRVINGIIHDYVRFKLQTSGGPSTTLKLA